MMTERRKFTGGKLVVASHNPGKVKEIADLLRPFGAEILSSGDLALPEPEETGDSFRANALLKAKYTTGMSGLPALADDSGLCVEALDGAPGIYSARWAGPNKDFSMAMERVMRELTRRGANDLASRRAKFVCALALTWPDGHAEIVEGEAHGAIVWPPRGHNGFGYDPIFLPQGGSMTYGEMAPSAKLAINHRAAAFQQLKEACFDGRESRS